MLEQEWKEQTDSDITGWLDRIDCGDGCCEAVRKAGVGEMKIG